MVEGVTLTPLEHSEAVEHLLLSDKSIDRAQGKLLATGFYENFHNWLDEGIDANVNAQEYTMACLVTVASILSTMLSRSMKRDAKIEAVSKDITDKLNELIVMGVKTLREPRHDGIQS